MVTPVLPALYPTAFLAQATMSVAYAQVASNCLAHLASHAMSTAAIYVPRIMSVLNVM